MKISNQHGDLLLEAITEIPATAKKIVAHNGFVLERGEGVHTHIFPNIDGIEVFEDSAGQTYVRVSKKTFLDHEEHGKQVVLPGIYKKHIERCFDYETMEARKVQD